MRAKLLLTAVIAVASAAIAWFKPPRLGLDLRGGSSLLLAVTAEGPPNPALIAETQRIVERKINEYGLSEATVQPSGPARLLVQIPAGADYARIRRSIERQGVLEWYAAIGGPYESREDAYRANGGMLPLNAKLFPADRGWMLARGPAVIRGADLKSAHAASTGGAGWTTAFTLSNEAGKRFGAFTEANIGKPTLIVFDGRVLSVPVIEERISADGQIRGARSREEAEDLAISLRAGAMPAALSVIHEATVGPTMGADSIRQGTQAGMVGLGAVTAAMIIYYGRMGVNAAAALALNGVIQVALLSTFDAVLTMPGIAGLVLTVGMAVDSNVLIFERIRELGSLSKGFDKAWTTIVDTHVTTVVSSGLLVLFGTPAVKGFAITLVLGLVTNVFTAVFVSRWLFEWTGFEYRGRAAPV